MLSVNHQIVGASIARPPFKRHHKQTVGVVEDADLYEDSFFL